MPRCVECDFFVSYTHSDLAWAEWIARTLNLHGYKILFQEWHTRGDFTIFMKQALISCRRTLSVLSPRYLRSQYCRQEALDRLAQERGDNEDLLVPILIRVVEDPQFLRTRVWANLIGKTEAEAETALLARIARAQVRIPEPSPGGPIFPSSDSVLVQYPRARQGPRHNTLPLLQKHTVRRFSAVTRIREKLGALHHQAPSLVVLAGIGGLGKSTTCRLYVEAYWDQYHAIGWIDATSELKLVTSLTELGDQLGLPIHNKSLPEGAQITRRFLERRQNWLLIFDGLVDSSAFNRYMPTVGGGHIIITSWGAEGWARDVILHLEPLTNDEAVELLLHGASSPADRDNAVALAGDMGGLPLALAQAAATMNAAGWGIGAYQVNLALRTKDVLSLGIELIDYPINIVQVWDTAMRQAELKVPSSIALIRILSSFGPHAIARSWLDTNISILPEELRDPLAITSAIASLSRVGLIIVERELLKVHRLIVDLVNQSIAHTDLPTLNQIVVSILDAATPRPAWSNKNWLAYDIITPHIFSLAIRSRRKPNLSEAVLYYNAALYLHSRGLYSDSMELYKRSKEVAVRSRKAMDIRLRSIRDLAILYGSIGDNGSAASMYEDGIILCERYTGYDSPIYAELLHGLGKIDSVQIGKDYRESLFQKAIALTHEDGNETRERRFRFLMDFADFLLITERPQDALGNYELALTTSQELYGKTHPLNITALHGLLKCYQLLGRKEDAVGAEGSALSIVQQWKPPEHPSSALHFAEIADLYMSLRRYDDADSFYQKCIEIGAATLGVLHPQVVRWLYWRARCLIAAGKIEAACGILSEVRTALRNFRPLNKQLLSECEGDLIQLNCLDGALP